LAPKRADTRYYCRDGQKIGIDMSKGIRARTFHIVRKQVISSRARNIRIRYNHAKMNEYET